MVLGRFVKIQADVAGITATELSVAACLELDPLAAKLDGVKPFTVGELDRIARVFGTTASRLAATAEAHAV